MCHTTIKKKRNNDQIHDEFRVLDYAKATESALHIFNNNNNNNSTNNNNNNNNGNSNNTHLLKSGKIVCKQTPADDHHTCVSSIFSHKAMDFSRRNSYGDLSRF